MLLSFGLVPHVKGQVVINEIFYDPADKTKALEFIELYNAGDAPVDLGQWRFVSGIKFSFPDKTLVASKSSVCVATDPKLFQKEFGFTPLGPWKGKLKNEGELLQLADARGAVVDEVRYAAGPPWPAQAAGGGRSLELINPAFDRKSPGSWRAGGPTPGKLNSIAAENASPFVTEAAHSPQAPKAGTSISIAARVSDPDGVKAVTLLYQLVEPGAYIRRTDAAYEKSWIELPMRDEGSDGDLKAGDGIYTTRLPATDAVHRRLIRYRIVAEDAKGMRGQTPDSGDPVPDFALYVYDGVPEWSGALEPGKSPMVTYGPALLTSLPTFQLLANADDIKHSQWDSGWNHRKFPGTLIFEGRVYDHIACHIRGSGSTYNTGKNKWAFQFARGHPLVMRDPAGRAIVRSWGSFSMNACASPWVPAHRGMAGLDEWFSSRIFELAGVPTARHIPVHFRVVDQAEETKSQFDSDFWGLYMAIENPDGSFLDERDLGDGSIYSSESDKKEHQGHSQPTDRSDLNAFMNQSRGNQPEAWWRAHLNMPVMCSFRAANRITGNVDLREGANHFLYHAPDERWAPIPWDLDMMLLPKTHQSGRIDQDRCFSLPGLQVDYANRSRELLDLLLADTSPTGGQIGQLIDEYATLIKPSGHAQSWADADAALWNFHPRTTGKGVFYKNPMQDNRMGGSWDRKLATPDFAGMCRYVLEYASDSRPATAPPWKLNDGDPRGYGFGYLRADAADPNIPERPTLSYSGPAGFPANALGFHCSEFHDPQGADSCGAVQWRLGQIASPGVAGWTAGQPRRYEIEPLWTSPEIAPYANTIRIPAKLAKPGLTYRVRVRMKDVTGRWSRWSEPVTFAAGAPL
ncbi:MAG: hypothetical protein JWL59_3161 [Chthoniobacteraceae bacterium]|nr:hypothetical protein [Chthoniobacteraceae bacterium]